MKKLLALLLLLPALTFAQTQETRIQGNLIVNGTSTFTGGQTMTGLLTANGGITVPAGQTLTLTGATVAGAPTWSSNQAITLSTAAQPNVTSVGTLTGLTVSGATITATSATASLGAVILDSGAANTWAVFNGNATNGSWAELRYGPAGGTVYGYLGSGSNLITGTATTDFNIRGSNSINLGIGLAKIAGVTTAGVAVSRSGSNGDVITFVGGGATPKTGYLYSDATSVGLFYGAGATNAGWYVKTGELLGLIGAVNVLDATSTGLAVAGALSATNTVTIAGASAAVSAGNINLGVTTQGTVGAAGGASALPATPLGYWKIFVAGTAIAIPYYNP